MFLFLADRAEHIEKIITPALQRNVSVISDRYMDSTIAYQGATLNDHFGSDKLSVLKDFHWGWATIPDMTILLDLDESEAFTRLSKRSDTYIEEFEKIDMLKRIRQNFLELAAAEPRRFVIVDAGENPTHVFEKVEKVILQNFPELLER